MSLDFGIYTADIVEASAKKFNDYATSLNLTIEMDLEVDLLDQNGFLPFKIKGDFIDDSIADKYFITGFEYYLNRYAPTPPPQAKSSFLDKLFKRKTVSIVETTDPFDELIKDSVYDITICCSLAYPFDKLVAYVYGAYMVEYFDGVFLDMYSGKNYQDVASLKKEIQLIIEEIKSEFYDGTLSMEEFQR